MKLSVGLSRNSVRLLKLQEGFMVILKEDSFVLKLWSMKILSDVELSEKLKRRASIGNKAKIILLKMEILSFSSLMSLPKKSDYIHIIIIIYTHTNIIIYLYQLYYIDIQILLKIRKILLYINTNTTIYSYLYYYIPIIMLVI